MSRSNNQLPAYDRSDLGNAFGTADGFIRFDLSSVPDDAIVEAATLTLFAQGPPYEPFGNPEISIWRSAADTWTRSMSGSFPRSYEQLLVDGDTGPFPDVRHEPYAFGLPVELIAWGDDLDDDYLTLVLTETSTSGDDYMYWYGSDGVTASGSANQAGDVLDYAPLLSIAYSLVPEPSAASAAIIILCCPLPQRRKR